jgi:hypothetical protein
MIDILKILKPSALNPPSANKSACKIKTIVMASVAAYGPINTAARAAPSRWPLVPAATGKLSICTAKIKVAVRPARGAVFSSSEDFAPRIEMATPAAATTAKAPEVGRSMNPSGICMA